MRTAAFFIASSIAGGPREKPNCRRAGPAVNPLERLGAFSCRTGARSLYSTLAAHPVFVGASAGKRQITLKSRPVMRSSWYMAAVFACSLLLVSQLMAADEKEVTLKGTITCAKCDLKQADKCATVIKVQEGGADVVYWFDPASHEKNHKAICMD